MPFTSDEALSALKLRCQIPNANGALTDTELFELLTEEMRTTLLAVVRKAQGEFYVKTDTVPVVVNQSDYRIPARAQTATLRDLKIRSTQNPPPSNLTAQPVPYISLERSDSYRNSGSAYWPTSAAHTIIGDMIRLLPLPTQTNYELLVRYYIRQNMLVPVASCAQVTNIVGPIITFANIPATWAITDTFDAQQAAPNFDLLDWDITADAIVVGPGGTLDLTTNGVPDGLVIGDYFCLAGETCVVELPVELQPALTSAASIRVLEVLGDRQGAQVAQDKYDMQINSVMGLLEPRNEGEPGKVVNRYSVLRQARRWRF